MKIAINDFSLQAIDYTGIFYFFNQPCYRHCLEKSIYGTYSCLLPVHI